jgi:hypothetical protein
MPIALLVLVVSLASVQPVSAQAPAGPPVTVTADLRGRFESDVDSRREDGTLRDDRHRGRVRARLEVRARPAPSLLVIGRVRTGSPYSQQSPHLTLVDFSGGGADAFRGVPDRFLLQYTPGRFDAWIGRNEFPFWTQNELFWDRDVTLPGGFASYRIPVGAASLQARGGYFGLPDGALAVRGRMAGGQLSGGGSLPGAWSWQGAVGLFDLYGASRTRHLLAGNGTRDYRIGVTSIQFTRALAGPAVGSVRIGADLLRNVRSYGGDLDPQAAAYRQDRTGVVLTTAVGGRRRPGERGAWEIGHTVARIEKLAVNASYAQDDWVRWGSATQTDSSNLRGHEVSGRYWIAKDVDCQARAFVVRSISTPQDGVRARVDVNWRFALTR